MVIHGKGKWFRLVGCAVLGVACSAAWAASLTGIPPYTGETASEGRAITSANGKVVVVGVSGDSGIIWDALAGTRGVLGSDSAG